MDNGRDYYPIIILQCIINASQSIVFPANIAFVSSVYPEFQGPTVYCMIFFAFAASSVLFSIGSAVNLSPTVFFLFLGACLSLISIYCVYDIYVNIFPSSSTSSTSSSSAMKSVKLSQTSSKSTSKVIIEMTEGKSDQEISLCKNASSKKRAVI